MRPWAPEWIKQLVRPLLLAYKRSEARRYTASASQLPAARRRYRATPKLVVFVSDVPRGREAKFAYGLRKKGWTVLLLHRASANYNMGGFFDEAIRFEDPDQAVVHGSRFSPVAYHVFSPSGDVSTTHFVNAAVGPTVFDSTDLLEVAYVGDPARTRSVSHAIDLQRHAIARADAVCSRDLQLKYAEKELHYARRGPVIFFPEYCWGAAGDPASAAPRDAPRTIRCVLSGNFGIEKRGEIHWGYLGIAERFADAGIGLDVYPNWTHYGRSDREFAEIFSDYIELAGRCELFRLHRPLKADELVESLRKFDFGVHITWSEVGGPRPQNPRESLHPYWISARIFDYLDAGLPVLLDRRSRLMHAILRRYGAGIPVDEDFMRDIRRHLAPLGTAEMKRRAARASHGLAVVRHVHRLEALYERVAADVGISAG